MLFGQPQLGFSITDPFKAVGRGVATAAKYGVKAAQDTRVQQAAAAAAQAYAPGQYAAATMYADRARGILRPGSGGVAVQAPPPPMAMMPAPMPDDDGGGASMAPVQKGNLLPIVMIAGGALVLLLILKK